MEHTGYSLALPPLILSPLIANDPSACVQVLATLANKLNQHPETAHPKKIAYWWSRSFQRLILLLSNSSCYALYRFLVTFLLLTFFILSHWFTILPYYKGKGLLRRMWYQYDSGRLMKLLCSLQVSKSISIRYSYSRKKASDPYLIHQLKTRTQTLLSFVTVALKWVSNQDKSAVHTDRCKSFPCWHALQFTNNDEC